MIDYRNPYTPGAGMMPKHMAGRQAIIDDAEMRLKAASSGYQFRSTVYYGLRGVGKTVLLNSIENVSEELGLLTTHIEVKESGNFVKAISLSCNGFVRKLSVKEAAKDVVVKLRAVMKAFTAVWNPEDQTVSFELGSIGDEVMSGTGDMANDLTELFVTLGRCARQAGTAVCFCVDEIQYAQKEELEAFITAIHRINQLGLPVVFFCAGLPKILKSMGDAKSYTERLFEFKEIGSLPPESAREAIIRPAEDLLVEYDSAAVDRILEITNGYPYFIQELCCTVWLRHNERYVTMAAVDMCLDEYTANLDSSFYKVRYDRCTRVEKNFMAAMVKCGRLPCTMANVAVQMGRHVKSISPFRGQLIDKGLVYSTSHGEIDFTVPKFDSFIKRHHPDFQE